MSPIDFKHLQTKRLKDMNPEEVEAAQRIMEAIHKSLGRAPTQEELSQHLECYDAIEQDLEERVKL